MMHFAPDKDDLYATVFSELKHMGIKVPKVKKFKSNILKQEKIVQPSTSRIFGVSLADQEWEADSDYVLPKFIVSSIAFLRQHTNKKGLFRKPGSVARLRELRVKLEKGENICGSEPNDVASLLKQWLRELPEPLIPQYMHDLFIRCQQLDNDENKITANLLTCLLLPPNHLYTLKYLLCFLADFAAHSNENLMGPYNLAMCVAPNIFVINDSADKTSASLVHIHVSIIQLLIENATKIGSIPEFITFQEGRSCSELDSSGDFLESACSKKKKQKNGHVQDLLSGIKKLVGQNSTSGTNAKTPEKNWNSHVTAPRSASKREADTDIESVLPIKKQPKLSVDQENVTPKDKGIMNFGTVGRSAGHIRKKSFGLLRKKERKRQKSCHGNPLPVVTFNVIPPENQTGETGKINNHVQAPEDSVPPASDSKGTKLSKSDSIKKSASESYLTPKYGKQHRFSFSPKSSDVKFEFSSYFLRPHKTNEKVEYPVEPTLLEDKNRGDVSIAVASPENLKTQNTVVIVTKPASEEKKSFGKGSINQEICKESKLLDQRDETPLRPKVQELRNGGACKRVSRKGSGNQVVGSRGKSDLSKRASSSELRSKCRNKSPQKSNKNSKTDLRSVSDSQIKHGSHRTLKKSPNCDKFSHKGALARNEAFIVKPKKQRENVLQHPRNASNDSTKANKRANPRRVRNENSLQKSQSLKMDIGDKTKVGKSGAKRASRNGSLIRGRPNTVNTGLRCELRGNESILVASESNERRKSQRLSQKNIFEESETSNPVETKKENKRGNESAFAASGSERKSLKLNKKNEVGENETAKVRNKNKTDKESSMLASQSHERRKSVRLNKKNEVDGNDSCILPDQNKVSDQADTSLNMKFENFHLSSPIHSSETLIDFINNMFSLDDKPSSLEPMETQNLSVDQSRINTRLSADKNRRASLQLKSDRSSSGSRSKIPRVRSFLENERTSSFTATPELKRKVPKNREPDSFAVTPEPKGKVSKNSGFDSFSATPEPKGKVSKNRGSDYFSVTPEPKGKVSKNRGSDSFSATPEPKGKVSKNRGSDSSSLNSSKIPIRKPDKSFDISSLQVSLDDSCFKTPDNFALSNSINWVSGSKYLGINSPEEDTYNKRESIALILRNNPGHVQAKVSMYDTRIRESVVCTRSVPTFSTPFEQFDNRRDPRSSQKNHRKLHDSRSYDSAQNYNRKCKKTRSPFPLPPKFEITEASTPSGSVFQPLHHGETVDKGNESRNSLKEVSFKDENYFSKKSSGSINHPMKESANVNSLLNESENSFNLSIKDENNISKRSMENGSHPLKEVTNISFETKSPLIKDGYILSENVLGSGKRQKRPKRSSFNAKSPHKRTKKVFRSESSPGRPRPYDKTRGCMRNSSSRSASIILERNTVK